jgi:hypothetical protein
MLRRLVRVSVPAKARTLHPHNLRHAFVAFFLDAGASLGMRRMQRDMPTREQHGVTTGTA